jgi:tetratricopeptide (TPR) repeat protein
MGMHARWDWFLSLTRTHTAAKPNPVMLNRALVLVASLVIAAPLRAQDHFVTQILIVPTFQGTDRGASHEAADIVRNRVADAFHNKGLRVISAGSVADWLEKSGYNEEMTLMPDEREAVARHFRADEEVVGTVTRADSGYRVEARIVLTRDRRMVQPFTVVAPSVREGAEGVAREVVAARSQMVPLRECENAVRAEQYAQAVTFAAEAIAAYPPATLARACLLSAVGNLPGDHADSILAVSRTLLARAPASSIALGYLAEALDSKGDNAGAGDAWVRLLATDSLSRPLIRRVVDALSREGNATLAEPIIVRGVKTYPDDLELLKLQWLVHLATGNWSAAVGSGEQLEARDDASRSDPDFYRRQASAYRADSQPVRALVTAATGVARFGEDQALYSLYVQLLQQENAAALPRGLARFPGDPDLHAIAAQQLKDQGALAQAASEMRIALVANPRLSHGWLQLADDEMGLLLPDSALVALDSALTHGESRGTVAQFALARGNALYTSANGTKQRADFDQARRFLKLANRLVPSPESAFLLGASALSVSQAAATEAPAAKSCDLVRLADTTLAEAEENLTTGRSVAPDAARQFLDYASTLRPYVADQLKALCPGTIDP